MSRFPRLRRRPDHWDSVHERARARAAERLDGPLGLAESTWLDEHLTSCAACAAIAAAYDADRVALRGLRDQQPVPPRDLWARTAAAIDAEAAPHGRSGIRGRSAPAASRPSRIPVGALSGIAVIAVVVGLSAVSGGLFDGIGGGSAALAPAGSPAVAAEGTPGTDTAATLEGTGAVPTPLAVGAGDVQWVRTDQDGRVAYNRTHVREVCPVDGEADCAAIDHLTGERLSIVATPKSIIGSPTAGQAIVVSDDGEGGEQILVLSLPTQDEPEPSPTAAPEATEPGSSGASDAPTATPSATPAASDTPVAPSEEPAPTEPVGSSAPSATPSDEPGPSATVSPEPTVAAALAIAENIAVVGESAAFSADGMWFAFTARPVDGSAGPDVYIWRVGDATATPLTTGGRSYFASWDGNVALVSRAGDEAARPSQAETVAIDPATGAEDAVGSWWRPIVDPSGQRAVAWVGTVSRGDDGLTTTAVGRLELRSWPSDVADGSAAQVVADDVGAEFDIRWDESGAWFAAWVGDTAGSTVGRLSLYRVDPDTGLLAQPDGAPVDVAALPGFSIGAGRLAWATPPGQGGEGSTVQIVAWAGDGVGTVETAPGEDLIVVR